jgi:hypothetical protein
MKDKELIGIAADIINTEVKDADNYENVDLYIKVKENFVSFFKDERVAEYTFHAKRNEWDEYTHDGGLSFLKGVLASFLKDSLDMDNRLDFLITLIIWCKRKECVF